MRTIHPLAVVDPNAELGDNVEVGPFCHVGPGVRLGNGCRLISHVALMGPAEFGENNVFFPGASLGTDPQDLKYRGGPTRLIVGNGNVFREQVTAHRGTEIDEHSGGATRIGDRCLFMVGVHVAHDANLGNQIILANFVQIAGHVRIEDCVNVGGLTAMHHFVTIGKFAYIAGVTRITTDVPPFMKVMGYHQAVRGVNIEGMRRFGAPAESITAVRRAARMLYKRSPENPTTAEALRIISKNGLIEDANVRYLCDFISRQMNESVYGRVLETLRVDQPEDRGDFYKATQRE
jgi:UDP-N-acetylglucosamine acyltransferase